MTPRPVAERPLIEKRYRGAAVVTVLVGVAVVTVLGIQFAGHRSAGRTDQAVGDLIDLHGRTITRAGRLLVDTGTPVPVGVLLMLLAALAWWWRGGRGLALVGLGPPLAMVTTSVILKPVIDRTHDGTLAFPSGHTTATASLAMTAAVLLLGTALPGAVRLAVAVALTALSVGVATALVGLGIHYPTDTVGGFAVALAVVLAAALLVDVVAARSGDRAESLCPDLNRRERSGSAPGKAMWFTVR